MALQLLPVALASFLQLSAATTATNLASNTSCAPARCGHVNITYPFSLSGVQPLYCGFPAFELTCDAGYAYLSRTFRERLYHVLDISYGSNSLALAVKTTFSGDEDGETCSIPGFNVSSGLSLFPLTISSRNKNLAFVYNCEVPPSIRLPRPCANLTMGAYISDAAEPWVDQKGCSSVSVPVRGFKGMDPTHDYGRMIRDGFLLEWPTLGECELCTRRGGECRFLALAFQCFCSDESICSTNPPGTKKKQNIKLVPIGSNGTGRKIMLIVLMSVAAILFLTCIYVLGRHRKREQLCLTICQNTSSNTERKIEALIVSHGSLVPKRYRYSEVTKITSTLNHKLGEGGCGMVLKGRLDHSRLVAVKLLHDSKGEGEEFVNEVMSIGRTSHVNIVSLFGFCLEGSKRALIYEFMPNGSLDKYIYSENPKAVLGWEKLYTIAIGIARGLEYLHHSCNTRIVHFDIKPQNILLDQDFQPKIADFGLAKLCRTKESSLSLTGARGTIGFIAPEVHSRTFGVVSTKSDVYSYGMMLLEMVGGRKNVNSVAQKSSEKYFPHWIYDHFGHGDVLQACEVSSENEGIARKMSVIGLWCIQILPMHHPTITKVLEMFERGLDELDMPPRQNFSQVL
ncbi:unnamed protein product [Urochloa decumbens]|uniref:Protein kinase domain-containing protein n=1 Tax=Urochloa decumbens TaxID=240449 RepID=A0ABC9AIA6_9POAL